MRKHEEKDRRQMVLAMEYIARQVNDESLFEYWLSLGVADGDINYGETDPDCVDEYYIEDENFADLMQTFINLISYAKKSGGLFCGDVVSKKAKIE